MEQTCGDCRSKEMKEAIKSPHATKASMMSAQTKVPWLKTSVDRCNILNLIPRPSGNSANERETQQEFKIFSTHLPGGGDERGYQRLETAGGGRQLLIQIRWSHGIVNDTLKNNGWIIPLRYPFYPCLSSRWHWKTPALILFFHAAPTNGMVVCPCQG